MGLAENLKRERERRGWSQRELARRAGVSHVTVAGAEGPASSNVTTVSLLAGALGVKPGKLAFGEE
jgi:transcriptional regulator with XRE-family HTH domain